MAQKLKKKPSFLPLVRFSSQNDINEPSSPNNVNVPATAQPGGAPNFRPNSKSILKPTETKPKKYTGHLILYLLSFLIAKLVIIFVIRVFR